MQALSKAAHGLPAEDPRTIDQARADLFVDTPTAAWDVTDLDTAYVISTQTPEEFGELLDSFAAHYAA
ncbi:MAG: hypothetical protein JWR55_792 [Aeromicrobium sp.]|nr:hypothetical protein [Aeromicrobium sp.]